MCPSYLATRDEKDSTRGRARVLQELANGTLVHGLAARRRSPSRWTCACPARAARPTARPAWTWPPTRPRCCTSGTGAGCGRAAHYSLGWLPRWARLASRAPGLANAALRAPGLAAAGQAAGRDRRPAAAAAVRRADLPRAGSPPGAGPPRRAATPVLLWVDTFTDALHPRGRPGRRARCSRRPGTRCRSPAEPVCCGLTWISTGQLDGARRQLRRSLRRARPGAERRASRSSASSPPAPRCCAASSPSCCPDDPRAARRRGRHPHAGRAAGRHRRLGRRPTWPACARWPSRTATSTP